MPLRFDACKAGSSSLQFYQTASPTGTSFIFQTRNQTQTNKTPKCMALILSQDQIEVLCRIYCQILGWGAQIVKFVFSVGVFWSQAHFSQALRNGIKYQDCQFPPLV